MDRLSELADRVESLTGADRSVDALIVTTLCPGATVSEYIAGEGDDIVFHTHPGYTHSIDAAMTLVPEGHDFGCGSHDATGKAWAWCGERSIGRDNWETMHPSNAATPALALTSAALRARSLVEVGHG